MKLNRWYALSLRVIVLFVTAMLVSFSPELLRGFFGDELYVADKYGYMPHTYDWVDEKWDWGFRHKLYFCMCICLFIVQAVRLFVWVDKNIEGFK
jgi:hypothetical protein